jgi:hypothetical protein
MVTSFDLRERVTGAVVAVEPWKSESIGAVLFKPVQSLGFGTWYEFTLTGSVDGMAVQKTVAFKTQ